MILYVFTRISWCLRKTSAIPTVLGKESPYATERKKPRKALAMVRKPWQVSHYCIATTIALKSNDNSSKLVVVMIMRLVHAICAGYSKPR
jgi:hypothetical protein